MFITEQIGSERVKSRFLSVDMLPAVAQNVTPMNRATERVRIARTLWTPFPNKILDKKFRALEENRAAAVYAVLHDRAYHSSSPIVKASISDIVGWTHLNWRVVKKCLRDLQRCGLVRKSKSRKRTWKIPLAKVDLSHGNWTPVPRVLTQRYIPAYHNSVLLLQILRIQNINWLDYAWASRATLAYKMGWSETRVRDAMRDMSDVKKWKRIADLPHPLSWKPPSQTGEGYRYRVRAVRYERLKPRTKPSVRFSGRFTEFLHIAK